MFPFFLLAILVGLPIFFALLVAPGIFLVITDAGSATTLWRNVYNGIGDSFILIAIPFFLLAGEIMNRGGITLRIVDFAQALVGHVRGGLAHVNVTSSIFFAGMSGSAVADTSALGTMLIPEMERNGYSRKFAAAITGASSVIGPIIPPSGILVIYAYVIEGVSIRDLFLAGIAPGILIGLSLMAVTAIFADKFKLPPAKRVEFEHRTLPIHEDILARILARIDMAILLYMFASGYFFVAGLGQEDATQINDIFAPLLAAVAGADGEAPIAIAALIYALPFFAVGELLFMFFRRRMSEERRIIFKRAVLPLQTPLVILSGILFGVVTPTEAAALAVAYALFISLFVLRSMKMSDLPGVFSRAALSSAIVLLLVGAAVAFKTAVAIAQAPDIAAEFVLGLSQNPLILLFLINILLFVVGMFLDVAPAIFILGPILAPIFIGFGVDPVHFAIIMCVNLTVGLATPPMGLVLFMAAAVSGERVETISKAILPFLAVEFIAILVITFVPAISLFIPNLINQVL
ncbi:MAG: TRAP transporter large permease [Hyphomicrobiales bacterium]